MRPPVLPRQTLASLPFAGFSPVVKEQGLPWLPKIPCPRRPISWGGIPATAIASSSRRRRGCESIRGSFTLRRSSFAASACFQDTRLRHSQQIHTSLRLLSGYFSPITIYGGNRRPVFDVVREGWQPPLVSDSLAGTDILWRGRRADVFTLLAICQCVFVFLYGISYHPVAHHR